MLEQSPAVQSAKDEIINELLKDLPSENAIEVELPSECRVYKLIDPEQGITIRPMTFEDEKVLVSANKSEDPVNIILNRCVTNINISDILPMDKLYLIMKLREISYGDDYHTMLICSNCKAENQTIIKLSQLNINPVPDDFCEPVVLKLPILQKEIKLRYPRVKDEKIFSDPEKSLDQLWRFVLEIDGHTDKSIISAVVNKLPLRDIRTILNTLRTDYGVDTNVKFECNSCGGVSVVDLPITANFFNVN